MNWKAIAHCAIGTSHKKQEMPCQDYGYYKVVKDSFVGAVADGAGSAKHSDLGAKIAVDTAIEYLSENLLQILEKQSSFVSVVSKTSKRQRRKKRKSHRNVDRKALKVKRNFQIHLDKEIFVDVTTKVKTALEEKAKNENYSFEDLACTLLVVVATPDRFAAMQIGDGFIVVRDRDNKNFEVLFPPDKGEYINETTFVTSSNALEAMRVKVQEGRPNFICASTDGLERVAIQMNDWTAFTPFFKPLEEYLQENNNLETDNKDLENFLNSEALNSRTDDDKTLLLCLYDTPSHSCSE